MGGNAGWISFSCQNNPSTCSTTGSYGVKIANYGVTTEHALAGKFTGYAWGENVGWISFKLQQSIELRHRQLRGSDRRARQ